MEMSTKSYVNSSIFTYRGIPEDIDTLKTVKDSGFYRLRFSTANTPYTDGILIVFANNVNGDNIALQIAVTWAASKMKCRAYWFDEWKPWISMLDDNDRIKFKDYVANDLVAEGATGSAGCAKVATWETLGTTFSKVISSSIVGQSTARVLQLQHRSDGLYVYVTTPMTLSVTVRIAYLP